MCVLKVCSFNIAHVWDSDRVPLCQMADVMSREKETARLHRCVWKTTAGVASSSDESD